MIRYTDIEHRATQAVQRPWLCMAVFAAAIVAAFFPTFGNLLQEGWDDQWQVVNHYTTSGFTWKNLCAIFTEVYGTQYSPIDQCMYTLLYLIDGYNPAVYHAASLLLHFANTCLVYTLLRRILQDTTHLAAARTAWIAFLTAMLFAIHPIQVEAVAWVSASKVILSTTFYLLATWAFITFLNHSKSRLIPIEEKLAEKFPLETGAEETQDANCANEHKFSAFQSLLSFVSCRWATVKWYLLTLLFVACAFASKEQTVTFPVWAALICVFYGHSFKRWSTWRILLPLFALALFFGLIFAVVVANYFQMSAAEAQNYTWWQRIVFSCYAVAEYVEKWYFPYHLLYLYNYPMEVGEPLPQWMVVYPLALGVVGVALWRWLRHWAVAAGLIFFLIHIAMVLHVIPLQRLNIVADRYIYLAAVGLSFVAAYALSTFWTHWHRAWHWVAAVAVVVLYCGMGTYTYYRTQVWHDSDRLHNEVYEVIEQ